MYIILPKHCSAYESTNHIFLFRTYQELQPVALYSSVAIFIVPDWEDKVNSVIGLSYRAARLHRLAKFIVPDIRI
jgi:hypothetical protein